MNCFLNYQQKKDSHGGGSGSRPFRIALCFFSCVLLVVLLQAMAWAAEAETEGVPRTLEKITVQLKWRHQFQFAGYYAAVAKGYYNEVGLEVELLEASPETDVVAQVVQRKAEFAVSSPEILIQRQQGAPLVVLAAIFQHSAEVLITRKDRGLLTPQDLYGKRIMLTPESDPENLAMLLNEGVPTNSVTFLPHSWSLDDLIDGRVDALTAYLTNEPYLLKKRGVVGAVLRPISYGIDFYGDCLITSEHEVRQHLSRVDAFRRATLRGWHYAMHHPEEIAHVILTQYSASKDFEQLLYEATVMQQLIRPDLVEIGYMNPARWHQIAQVYVQLGMMTPEYSLEDFLFTELRDKIVTRKQRFVFLAVEILAGLFLLGIASGIALLVFNTRLSELVRKKTSDLAVSEQHFRAFFEMASVGVAQVELRTARFIQINRKYCQIVGYSEEEMLTDLTAQDLTHPEDRQIGALELRELVAGRIPEYTVEKRYVHKDGSVVWILLTVSPLWRPREKPVTSLAVVRDITKRKMAEEELIFATKVFEHSIEGIVVTDAHGTIMQVNPAFTAITGYQAQEAIGENPKILKSDRHSPIFYETMWQQLIEEGHWAGEIWNRRQNGEIYPEWLTINAVRNAQGKTTNYVSIFHDITELKRQQAALEHQAQHDALTGLPNRVLLNDRLEMALARMKRIAKKVALLFLDLDNFKNINDGFGHATGDTVLLELARRLKGQLREVDTLARQGGDEFLILLPDISTVDDVSLIAMRLLESFQQPFHYLEHEYYLTASIGVTLAPDDGNDPAVLVKNADLAMYRAKKLGRNNYQFFTPELDLQAHRRVSLEAKLRKALETEDFELYYQPKIRSDDGAIVGAEALIRWHHEGELISPGEFIPVSEESGLILPMGQWVLRTAAKQAKVWQDAGYELDISVNISSRQFAEEGLTDLLREVLAVTGVQAGRLYFEITESMLMYDIGKASRTIAKLRELGGRFYLDDFGTGYSSLAYLNRLSLDGLKIDRSFIRDIEKDAESTAIVTAIVSLARTLNLNLVAEGVETISQLQVLRTMGGMLIQGYLASPPVPAARFEELLKQPGGLLTS